MFINQSTITPVQAEYINRDIGVLKAMGMSYDKFQEGKFLDAEGNITQKGKDKIKQLLINKHKSPFFLSRIEIKATDSIPLNSLSKEEIAGLEWDQDINNTFGEFTCITYSISLYLAMRWLFYKPDYINGKVLQDIELEVKKHFPACYEALNSLPQENVTKAEKKLMQKYKTSFVFFVARIPIFIARQFYRTRDFQYTERSGRYTGENIQFFKPDQWRKSPQNKRQGSVENEFVEEKHLFGELNSFTYNCNIQIASEWFQENEGNIALEQARIALPQSQITHTLNAINLTSLCNFLNLRIEKTAQKEIQDVAIKLREMACEQFSKETVGYLIDIQKRLVF